MKNILVLLAQPTRDTFKVKAALFKTALGLNHAATADLYKAYPYF